MLEEIERSNRTNALFQGLEVTPGSYPRSVAKSTYSGQPNVIGNLEDQDLSDARDLTDPNDLTQPLLTNEEAKEEQPGRYTKVNRGRGRPRKNQNN